MRRLGLAITLALLIALSSTTGPALGVEVGPGGGEPAPPQAPQQDVPPAPGGPDDIEPFLCDATDTILSELEANGAGDAVAPVREQHGDFCSGGDDGEDPDPVAVVCDAAKTLLDAIDGLAGAGTTDPFRDGLADVCPGLGSTTTTTGGGGDTTTTTADTTTTSGPTETTRPTVLGGGTAGDGELPRTGTDLIMPLGFGTAALAAGLRRLIRR